MEDSEENIRVDNMGLKGLTIIIEYNENDVLFSNDTGKLGKRNSECSYQESNLRPSNY